ncbi:MAG TPA: hypothetical protein VF590_08635, partial [Isosphaeraceae bacterium]
MSGWELKIIAAEAHRLVALAAEDDDLRTALRALAESILAATAAASPPEVIRDDPAPPEPLRELTLGRSRPPSAPEGSPAGRGPSTGFDPDLAAIAAQCRRKATAARWAARCQGHPAEGADPGVVDGPTDPEMV